MQHTWNGNDGSYTDPTNRTPQDVPLHGGASALIQPGTVTLSDAEPNGITISLSGPSQATNSTRKERSTSSTLPACSGPNAQKRAVIRRGGDT